MRLTRDTDGTAGSVVTAALKFGSVVTAALKFGSIVTAALKFGPVILSLLESNHDLLLAWSLVSLSQAAACKTVKWFCYERKHGK